MAKDERCIWYTPAGYCGPARVPAADILVECEKKDSCGYLERGMEKSAKEGAT